MSPLEISANVFNVLSVWLAARNHKLTWPVGILGCALYGVMFFQTRLYADVTLQLFFILTSLGGWWKWTHVGKDNAELPVGRVNTESLFFVYFPTALVAAFLYGYLLHSLTDASLPFIDSIVLTFSVVATFLLMARKLETWLFWIIVDTVAVPLYAYKGLHLTSAVYAFFWLNAIYGFWMWRQKIQGLSHATV